jgi:hypothetical protein
MQRRRVVCCWLGLAVYLCAGCTLGHVVQVKERRGKDKVFFFRLWPMCACLMQVSCAKWRNRGSHCGFRQEKVYLATATEVFKGVIVFMILYTGCFPLSSVARYGNNFDCH